MKNLIQYRYSFEKHFFAFINGEINLDELIRLLKSIEEHHRQLTKNFTAELWLKFGRQDTLATDINDLKKDLEPHSKNYDFTLERITDATKLQGTELLIHFS